MYSDRMIDLWTFPECDSHQAVSEIISEYTGIPEKKLEISGGLFVKPRLINNDAPEHLHFNLSHSAGEGILALSSQPVGIDIEFIRPLRSADDAIRFCCTEEEIRVLMSIDPSEREQLFYELWCRKEACVKALGMDILSSAGQFQCLAEADKVDRNWSFLEMFWQDGSPWYLKIPLTIEGYATACVTPLENAVFQIYSWKEERSSFS